MGAMANSDLGPGAPQPTDPTNDYRVPAPRACEACGSHLHGPESGSVSVYVRCLVRHLQGARESLKRALSNPREDRYK